MYTSDKQITPKISTTQSLYMYMYTKELYTQHCILYTNTYSINWYNRGTMILDFDSARLEN